MNVAITCASSELMSELLTWRNPNGSEEHWLGLNLPTNNYLTHIGKIIVTEIALLPLACLNLAELITSTFLFVLSLAIVPISQTPVKFFLQHLNSTSFTFGWLISYLFYYNFFLRNIVTNESFARYYTHIHLSRLDDIIYIHQWRSLHRSETVRIVNMGRDFLANEVLAGASTDTITDFQELDPEIYSYILTKAAYIYAAGAEKTTPIPQFFKPETRDLIAIFRQEFADVDLDALMKNPETFQVMPTDNRVLEAFNSLRSIGANELQDSMLATTCWQKAIELLKT